jgi:hypothetical protein
MYVHYIVNVAMRTRRPGTWRTKVVTGGGDFVYQGLGVGVIPARLQQQFSSSGDE